MQNLLISGSVIPLSNVDRVVRGRGSNWRTAYIHFLNGDDPHRFTVYNFSALNEMMGILRKIDKDVNIRIISGQAVWSKPKKRND